MVYLFAIGKLRGLRLPLPPGTIDSHPSSIRDRGLEP